MRFPDSLAISLLPPFVAIFPEKANSFPVEKEQRTT
jgi:hypothetical protein